MVTSQLCDSRLLACNNYRGPSFSTDILPYQASGEVENQVPGICRAETRSADSLDPFTFYKTYLDTNVRLLGDQDDFESDDDSYTYHPRATAAHVAPVDGAQPQASGHTAAYKLAVRLANRSNGAPLATIVEQGSYSTLTSHGSLLSVRRFSSLRTAENTSPNRGPRRRSRSPDGKALHDIQEDLTREHDMTTMAVPHARPDEEFEAADPTSGTIIPLEPYCFDLQKSSATQSSEEIFDHDKRGVKRFVRGVLQNVRGVSRSRSRSPSMTHALIIEHQESAPSTGESSPQPNQQGRSSEPNHSQRYNRNVLARASEGVVAPSGHGNQIKNRAISSPGLELSARTHPRLSQSGSSDIESDAVIGSIQPVLSCRAVTCSHDQPPSTPTVRRGIRDVACEDSIAQASTSVNHDILGSSARYTFDGVPVYRGCPSSLKGANSARDVFAGQNSSFCSTMSTSYSGTVLGVDVDLQHDFSRPIRRSQSPPTPVWFTPQMTELERQASLSVSPESVKANPRTQVSSRLITSSAMTSLLPIAAASGIVRPNYDTPKISFYSPSGSLIQLESSSPQDASPLGYGGSLTITTSNYNKQNNSSASSYHLPIRPPLVPMTTPPTHKDPLPRHLRHHHNYQHPEKSQISSCESVIVPKGPVKGCDGVVRENSFTPRSGVFYPHVKDRIHRSTRVIMHDLKDEVRFYKSRFIALAAAQSFAPSIPKGRTLQKRHVTNYNTYASKPHRPSLGTTDARKGHYREDVLGPIAAHALRMCFCQPYDGAGKPIRATAAGVCLAGEPFPKNTRSNPDHGTNDAERSLPNARVIVNGKRSGGDYVKRRTTKGSTTNTTQRSIGGTMQKVD